MQVGDTATTAVGGSVSVRAAVRSVEGREVAFEVSATDDNGPVGRGDVTRIVVDRDRFVARLR